jgi:hypothetical protein
MSDLTNQEITKISKLLIHEGYVLNFSNRTFAEFVEESIGINAYEEKYANGSGSKGQRLKAILKIESNYKVGKLLQDLAEYWNGQFMPGEEINPMHYRCYEDALKIAKRLRDGAIVDELEVIQGRSDDRDFTLLADSIRTSIGKDQPELALDRLHTFVFHFIRELCKKHDITFTKDESLNAVFGKYIKTITARGLVETLMGEKILKYSINLLDSFNDVRNNKTFAHANALLNYDESLLILNNITNAIRYIKKVEGKYEAKQKFEAKAKGETKEITPDDIAF